jgi:lysophospholipase L1-like esterase
MVVVVFVLFTVVATVWVRGQYAEPVDGRPWSLPWPWLLLLAVAAITCLVVYGVARKAGPAWGTLLLVGIVLAYLTAGFLVTRLRTIPRRLWWGLALVFLGAVAGAVLLMVLGDAGAGWVITLAAVAAFSLPPGVAMLSEAAIDRLAKAGGPLRRGLIVLGALGFGAVSMTAVDAAESRWVLLPFAALGLLVVALASATQADIVVVLALVALMGVTPQQARPPDEPTGGKQVLVALGDSYMSGEGARRFFAGTDEGGGNGCRRAPTAWAAMAGTAPLFDGIDFLACSGARTYNIRADKAAGTPKLIEQEDVSGARDTQLLQYDRNKDSYEPSLVVLSIGGNDAGFATIGQMCLAPGDCSTEKSLWLAGLDEVETELRRTYAEVREDFGEVPVVVIPYPSPIAEDESGTATPCDEVALMASERTFITQFLDALNGRIRAAAAEAGFYYLAAMRNALRDAGLQLCDPRNEGRPGINFIGLRSVNGTPEQRFNPANWTHNSLHPNERGHAAMLRTFQIWRAENPQLDPVAPPDEEAPSIEEAERPVPGTDDCSVYDTTEDGCRAIGTRWALRAVGGLALPEGLLVILAAAGAWLAAVAFFGSRRRSPGSATFRPRDGDLQEADEQPRAESSASGRTTASSTDEST